MNTRIITVVAVLALGSGAAVYTSGCSSMTGKSTGEFVDDAAMTAKVKAELIRDPIVKARQINVDTTNGVVQLNGTVDTPDQRARAEQIARNVAGMNAVQDNLQVRGLSPGQVGP